MSLIRVTDPIRQAKILQIAVPVTTDWNVEMSESVPPNGSWPAGRPLAQQQGVHLGSPVVLVQRTLYPGADYHCANGFFRFPMVCTGNATIEAASLIVQIVDKQRMDGAAFPLIGEWYQWDDPIDEAHGYKHMTIAPICAGVPAFILPLSAVSLGLCVIPLAGVKYNIKPDQGVTLRLFVGGGEPVGTNMVRIAASEDVKFSPVAVVPQLLCTVAL